MLCLEATNEANTPLQFLIKMTCLFKQTFNSNIYRNSQTFKITLWSALSVILSFHKKNVALGYYGLNFGHQQPFSTLYTQLRVYF